MAQGAANGANAKKSPAIADMEWQILNRISIIQSLRALLIDGACRNRKVDQLFYGGWGQSRQPRPRLLVLIWSKRLTQNGNLLILNDFNYLRYFNNRGNKILCHRGRRRIALSSICSPLPTSRRCHEQMRGMPEELPAGAGGREHMLVAMSSKGLSEAPIRNAQTRRARYW